MFLVKGLLLVPSWFDEKTERIIQKDQDGKLVLQLASEIEFGLDSLRGNHKQCIISHICLQCLQSYQKSIF